MEPADKINKINRFIKTWSKEKTIQGKSFDELFNIEGIPLWWFFKRFFVAHVMPRQINTFKQIYTKKKLTKIEDIKLFISSKAISKYLKLNEKRKIKYFRGKRNSSKEKKVLFFTYANQIASDGRIYRLQSIINKIKQDNKLKELIIFTEPLSEFRYKKNLPYNHLYKYFDENISEKAEEISDNLSKLWKDIDNKTKQQMLKLNRDSLWPYLKYAFNLFMSKEFLYILVLYYELIKKILQEENVEVVLLSSTNGLLDKCAMAAAKQQGRTCLIIQHGTGTFYGDYLLNPDLLNPDLVEGTKLLVFSDFYKENFLQTGMKEEDIVVVGPAILDEITKHTGCKKIQQRSNILFATSPFVEDNFLSKENYFNRISKILSDIKKIENAHVILKLHPREKRIKKYKDIMKKLGYRKITVLKDISEEEFHRLISECDSFISLGSMATVEAMIIDKPVVIINILGSQKNYINSIKATFIEDSKAMIRIDYKDDIKEAVERSFKDEEEFREKRKEFVKKLFYRIDGKASERVVDYIYQLKMKS